MKWLLVGVCLFVGGCESTKVDRPGFSGNTDYTSVGCTKELKTKLGADFKVTFYEPKSKKWLLCGRGRAVGCYDQFGQELNMNVFTTLGLDF